MEPEEIRKMSEIEDEHWWFRGKRNLVRSHLKNGGIILDIGCGTGANIKSFSIGRTAIGSDFSADALGFCKNSVNVPLVRCSAESLPFKDDVIDTITILDVLEHLDGDVKAMKEIRRVLKVSGNAIITVPAHMFLWHRHDVLLHHRRRYSMKELKTKLLASGFEIKKMSYWNFVLFPMAAIYKFLNKDTDTDKTNGLLNALLYFLLTIDNILIKYIRLPFGISIFCVVEKK